MAFQPYPSKSLAADLRSTFEAVSTLTLMGLWPEFLRRNVGAAMTIFDFVEKHQDFDSKACGALPDPLFGRDLSALNDFIIGKSAAPDDVTIDGGVLDRNIARTDIESTYMCTTLFLLLARDAGRRDDAFIAESVLASAAAAAVAAAASTTAADTSSSSSSTTPPITTSGRTSSSSSSSSSTSTSTSSNSSTVLQLAHGWRRELSEDDRVYFYFAPHWFRSQWTLPRETNVYPDLIAKYVISTQRSAIPINVYAPRPTALASLLANASSSSSSSSPSSSSPTSSPMSPSSSPTSPAPTTSSTGSGTGGSDDDDAASMLPSSIYSSNSLVTSVMWIPTIGFGGFAYDNSNFFFCFFCFIDNDNIYISRSPCSSPDG